MFMCFYLRFYSQNIEIKWEIPFTFILEHVWPNVFCPHCSIQIKNHWLAKKYMGIKNYLVHIWEISCITIVWTKKIPKNTVSACMLVKFTYIWNLVEKSLNGGVLKIYQRYCFIKISNQNYLFQCHRCLN